MDGGIISNLDEHEFEHAVSTLLDISHEQKIRDLHIEPRTNSYTIRTKSGPHLSKIDQLTTDQAESLIHQLFTKSHLRRASIPQEGHFKHGDLLVQFSTLPVLTGTKVFLHLTDQKMASKDLASLGLSGDNLALVKRIPEYNSGLIIVLGEGRTTTMFSILSLFDAKKFNISTIENRLTYRLPHVNQFIAEGDFTHQAELALSAAIKQRSKVIYLSQITSPKLAELAVEATNNHQIIITSLPITDPFVAVDFLVNLGIPSFLLLHSLRLIISQQLISINDPNGSNDLTGLFEVLEITDHYRMLYNSGLPSPEIKRILNDLPS